MSMPLTFFGRSAADARERRSKSQSPLEPVEDFSPTALVKAREKRRLVDRVAALCDPARVVAFFRGRREAGAQAQQEPAAAGFGARGRKLLTRMGFSSAELDAMDRETAAEMAAAESRRKGE